MSTRLSRGRSTPAIRATLCLLPLALLVPRVRADHPDLPAPADHLAPVADLLHGRPNLHVLYLEGLRSAKALLGRAALLFVPRSVTCSGRRSARASGRTG